VLVGLLMLAFILLLLARIERDLSDFTSNLAGAASIQTTPSSADRVEPPEGGGASRSIDAISAAALSTAWSCTDEGGIAAIALTCVGPAGEGITDWSWHFGDGETGHGRVVTHRFSTSGDYPVTLTVSTPTGSLNGGTVVEHVEESRPATSTASENNRTPGIGGSEP